MTSQSHLCLTEIVLAAGAEWTNPPSCWGLARLAGGHGYWMGRGDAREIQLGEAMIIPPAANGVFRASQVTGATLQYFSWSPDLLTGVLSLTERHFFATAQRGQPTVRVVPASQGGAIAFDTDQAAIPLVCRSRLLQFIGEVFSPEISRHVIPSFKSVSATDRFEELINHLTDSELLNFTPAQLSQRCGCSLRHFGRLFYNRLGVSVRTHQTKLRLQKAGLLLSNGDTKVIEVALESGYRNLGLFNKMFKKYTGMTPTQWRQKNSSEHRSARSARAILAMAGLFLCCNALPITAADAPSQAAPAAKTNTSFKITGYRVEGNTVLEPDIIKAALAHYIGDAMTFAEIKKGLSELQLAYRERGFISAKVGLPQQSLTNGIVRVTITEAKLVDISINNNKWFSSNNVMAALPSLRTNTLLNSLVFQQELNQANANRDRQIYPEITPGPEPGTTALRLKVVDRIPLHSNFELNNQSTPGTPDLRMNAALQYNNLWQLNHQLGVQYNFSPEEFKTPGSVDYFFDRPEIVSYSGFYRMPLTSGQAETQQNLTSADFGYDEVTKRFRPPPPLSAGPEITFYASRSVSDTGRSVQSDNLINGTIDDVKRGGGTNLYVDNVVYTETMTFNENIGFKVTQPLKLGEVDSFFTTGIDYKAYRAFTTQNHDITAAFYKMLDTNAPWTDPNNWSVSQVGIPSYSSQITSMSVNYLPLTFNWDATRRDRYGVTAFNFNNTFNFASMSSSPAKNFMQVRQSSLATGDFYILNSGLSRDQRIAGEWYVLLKANGQWANQPLIGNEQFGLGGLDGPRGYREGEEYGDSGWRVTIEPRTPMIDIGMVDGTMPMRVRFSAFTDYGQRFLYSGESHDPLGVPISDGTKPTVDMWGVGAGLNGTIGSRLEFRLAAGWPLLKAGGVTPGTMRIYFGLSAQF